MFADFGGEGGWSCIGCAAAFAVHVHSYDASRMYICIHVMLLHYLMVATALEQGITAPGNTPYNQYHSLDTRAHPYSVR